MKHEIIKTDNYLLVVDESEIKFDDWYIDDSNLLRPSVTSDKDYWSTRKDYKKVIAHLPLNDSPILESVDLLPPLEEDDMEKLAFEYTSVSQSHRRGFMDGYNKAKEKYKYTEEDMRKAISETRKGMLYNKQYEDEYIKSLPQPKMPIGFECVMEKDFRYNDDGEPFGFKVHNSDKITTTTTPEGHTQWVGTYIY